MIPAIWQDLLFGARLMRRRPACSLTAIGVLSLGIAVNTALFSVVNALFFTPLPVTAPHQLFYVYQRSPEGRTFAPRMGAEELELLRAQTGDVAEYALHADTPVTLTVGDDTERATGETVSGNYFALLGVTTAHGRPLGTQDDDASAPPAIVISYSLWESRLLADPAVVGRSIRLNDRLVTIVGVARRGFFGGVRADGGLDSTHVVSDPSRRRRSDAVRTRLVARSPGAACGSGGRRGARAPHRDRKHRGPAAGAWRDAHRRSRRPSGARRGARPAYAAVARGERTPFCD